MLSAFALPDSALAQTAAPEWRLVCAADVPQPSPRMCQLRYELTSDTGRRVLRVTIGLSSGEGEPTWFINALLPLGLYIPSGAGYVVDGAPAVPLQLQECTTQGCRAIGALPPERLQALKDGLEIQFVFADSVTRKGIGLSVSLVGFTAAVEAMRAVGD